MKVHCNICGRIVSRTREDTTKLAAQGGFPSIDAFLKAYVCRSCGVKAKRQVKLTQLKTLPDPLPEPAPVVPTVPLAPLEEEEVMITDINEVLAIEEKSSTEDRLTTDQKKVLDSLVSEESDEEEIPETP